MRLVKIEEWEDEWTRYIVLGDKDTRGQSYAECLVIPKSLARKGRQPNDPTPDRAPDSRAAG